MSMSLSACLLACFSFTTIIQNCSLSIMAVATNRNRWGNGRHLITGQLGRWLDFRCRYWIYDEVFSFLDPCFEFDFFCCIRLLFIGLFVSSFDPAFLFRYHDCCAVFGTPPIFSAFLLNVENIVATSKAAVQDAEALKVAKAYVEHLDSRRS